MQKHKRVLLDATGCTRFWRSAFECKNTVSIRKFTMFRQNSAKKRQKVSPKSQTNYFLVLHCLDSIGRPLNRHDSRKTEKLTTRSTRKQCFSKFFRYILDNQKFSAAKLFGMDNFNHGRQLKCNKSALHRWVSSKKTSVFENAVGRLQISKYFCKKSCWPRFFSQFVRHFFVFVIRPVLCMKNTDTRSRSRLGDIVIYKKILEHVMKFCERNQKIKK